MLPQKTVDVLLALRYGNHCEQSNYDSLSAHEGDAYSKARGEEVTCESWGTVATPPVGRGSVFNVVSA